MDVRLDSRPLVDNLSWTIAVWGVGFWRLSAGNPYPLRWRHVAFNTDRQGVNLVKHWTECIPSSH